jgi:hypothetical protein
MVRTHRHPSIHIVSHIPPSRKELGEAVKDTYNLAPTLCIQVPWITAKVLFNGRDWKGQMTLDDLNAHGGIEHDASYTRT